MKILGLILVFGMQACGQPDSDDTMTTYDMPQPGTIGPAPIPNEPALAPYAELFYAQAEEHGVAGLPRVPIRFLDLENPTHAGACLTEGDTGKPIEIQIDKPLWDASGPWTKRALIAHELGHCALGRHHTLPNVWSFMLPELPSEYEIFYYYDAMWDELFETQEGD